MPHPLQRVVIFGATSAIAIAVARQLAAENAQLFLVARNAERLDSVAADLRVRGAARVDMAVADLADTTRHAALVAEARISLQTIDGALIAHGTLPDQTQCERDAAVALQQISINFLSPASILTELAAVMAAQGSGRIGVIGSVAGDRGRMSNYVYGSAKGGLGVFVQGLRHRLGKQGVSVTLIKPGFVDTPMTAHIAKGGPLWATAEKVAADIVKAMRGGKATLYTPWFWAGIMATIRNVPDFIFGKTRL
ncbi:MAG: SDR family oxidoreductase [Pseudomonadota bacterium]